VSHRRAPHGLSDSGPGVRQALQNERVPDCASGASVARNGRSGSPPPDDVRNLASSFAASDLTRPCPADLHLRWRMMQAMRISER
jgi:hypothetical protein